MCLCKNAIPFADKLILVKAKLTAAVATAVADSNRAAAAVQTEAVNVIIRRIPTNTSTEYGSRKDNQLWSADNSTCQVLQGGQQSSIAISWRAKSEGQYTSCIIIRSLFDRPWIVYVVVWFLVELKCTFQLKKSVSVIYCNLRYLFNNKRMFRH